MRLSEFAGYCTIITGVFQFPGLFSSLFPQHGNCKKDVDKPTGICYYTQAGGNAGVAQSVEQLICNQQVGGSSPSTSSNTERKREYGGIPEWPKGTDCKSAGNAFGGSNPPSPTKMEKVIKLIAFSIFLYVLGPKPVVSASYHINQINL